MKTRENQLAATLFLAIVLVFSSMMAAIPQVQATDLETYAFLSVTPRTVGVGEQVLVLMWLSSVPPTAQGAGGDRWQGYNVVITKPDGSTENQGPFTSDAVAGAYFMYTPQIVGRYTFQFSFPGQTISATNNYYKPSTSPIVELTVQQAPTPQYPEASLPTDDWTRPIYGENRAWASIGGNWLMAAYDQYSRAFDGGSAFAPYTKAPNTPHIVWIRELMPGGLVGGEYGSTSYYSQLSYESAFTPPIIINGKLYYNSPNWPRYGFYCIDLRTGEEIWYNNGTLPNSLTPLPPPASSGGVFPGMIPVSMGQIYDYESMNQHGAIAYLWGIWTSAGTTRYDMYDARTGNWILSLVNGSAGTPVFAQDGSILVYIMNGQRNWLAMWNSSKAIPPPWPDGSGAYQWRPGLNGQKAILDWNAGLQWNVTIPSGSGTPQAISKIDTQNWIILATSTINTVPIAPGSRDTPNAIYQQMGYDAKTGQRLWIQNRSENLGDRPYFGQNVLNGVYTMYVRETMTWYGFDIRTGNQLWGPSVPYTNAWGMYLTGTVSAYGKLYATAYDGMIHCYDLTTGANLWNYYGGDISGTETPYGHYPYYGGITVADGKVYACNGEHSPSMPLIRGEKMTCVDANTGAFKWNISGWYAGNQLVIADGYLVAPNAYDNRIYCFGKGPTETTVNASPKIALKGSSVLIEGTVTDQSPAQKGTPAIGDQYMAAWMEYLNMQYDCPANIHGVPVILQAIDSDGNTINIGQVTSDALGYFHHQWTPPDQKTYRITATFAGSESYFSSFAETGIGVSGVTLDETKTEAPLDLYIIIATIIILIAIALAVILICRR